MPLYLLTLANQRFSASQLDALLALKSRIGYCRSQYLSNPKAWQEQAPTSWQVACQTMPETDELNYKQALTYLYNFKNNSPVNLQQLHQQLHPRGGQLRRVNLKQVWQHSPAAELESLLEQLMSVHHQTTIDGWISAPVLLLDLLRIAPFLGGNLHAGLLMLRAELARNNEDWLQAIDIESAFMQQSATIDSFMLAEQPSLDDWLQLCWHAFNSAIEEFAQRLNKARLNPGRGSKTALVRDYIAHQSGSFSITDICAALPTVSTDMVRTVIRALRDEGCIAASSRGRGARWQKI
jgi:aryl carrier-like protein